MDGAQADGTVVREEVVLPRRVREQPTPNLNPGGDCGPCCLAGVLGWTVPEVYERLRKGQVGTIGYADMQTVLHRDDLFDRKLTEAPLCWETYEIQRAFGQQAHHQGMAWFSYVRMAVDAGYYGIANVDHARGGPLGRGPDHWVLVCGARLRGPGEGKSGRVYQEVLVSDSARSTAGESWVDADDFLRERGGFNLLLCRPRA